MPNDSDAGIGVGTPVSTIAPVIIETCTNLVETHLSLEEYWDFLQINEIAGYGIRNYPTTDVLGHGCGDYWNQSERYYLAQAIRKAEQRLESDRWLGFPLRRQYYPSRQLDYQRSVFLGKYLRSIGVNTYTLVEDNKAVVLSSGGVINDPVEFTVTVNFTDPDELIIVRPGTTYCLIRPSYVSISGTTATVRIPRARLLKAEYFKNYKQDIDRPNYMVDASFLASVDVYRNYIDTTTGANVVWWRHPEPVDYYNCLMGVSALACSDIAVCSDIRQLCCGYVRNQRMGEVTLEPATYSDGWSKASYAIKRPPDGYEVSYMRGRFDRYDQLDSDLTRAVIAIAHNNLPRDYCSCDQQTLYYQDDTRPLEPPVRLGLGRSTWGLYEAEQIIREYDSKTYGSYAGGLM